MHEIDIPRRVVDRVIKRRGAQHVFQDFDPTRTALIVIDMQNAFMLPGVAFVEIKTAPEIVPNINRLAGAVRAAGATVVWIVTNYTDEVAVDWSTYYRLSTLENGERRSKALVKGTRGHQIWDTLEVLPGDPIIEKARFSALVCCESTARDAALTAFYSTFGDIMPTDMIVGLLG